jgi:hypothetical protein
VLETPADDKIPQEVAAVLAAEWVLQVQPFHPVHRAPDEDVRFDGIAKERRREIPHR